MKSLAIQKTNWNISQKKLVINNTTVIEIIAENLNKNFTNTVPNLASKITNKKGDFEEY